MSPQGSSFDFASLRVDHLHFFFWQYLWMHSLKIILSQSLIRLCKTGRLILTVRSWCNRLFDIARRFSHKIRRKVQKPCSTTAELPCRTSKISMSISICGYNDPSCVKKWDQIICWCSFEWINFKFTDRFTWVKKVKKKIRKIIKCLHHIKTLRQVKPYILQTWR